MLQVEIPGGVWASTLYVIGKETGSEMPSGTVAGCHDNITAFGMKSRTVGSSLGKTGAMKR